MGFCNSSFSDDDLEKCVFEFCWTTTIKPRQKECSIFFLLNHNGKTRVYRTTQLKLSYKNHQPPDRVWSPELQNGYSTNFKCGSFPCNFGLSYF